ncbi:MAG: SGNH/GDSL hydrolase family protein [Ancrocorticia populi]
MWIHHGSSISQGSNATEPSETWLGMVARRMGYDVTNLGFGGSCFVDQFMARTIRDLRADVISLNFGINVVNLDGMKHRVFVPAVHGFLDTIRDGHPETPIVLSSPLYCGIHEDTPGPGAFDPETFVTGRQRFIATGTQGDTANGRLTLQTVREALKEVMSHRADDPNLYYIEGTDLFGEKDAEAMPLTDNLHPSPDAHRLIGERVVERMTGLEPATLTLAR